jgi:hypothetical protein
MNLGKHDRNLHMAGWIAGVALVSFGVYQLLKSSSFRGAVDLEPASKPTEPQPYYNPHPRRHAEAALPKNQPSIYRARVGNSPGERNQIGGRASGKTARFN